MSNCPVASCTSQLDVPLEDLGISHCEEAAYLRIPQYQHVSYLRPRLEIVWLRLSSMYLACSYFTVVYLQKGRRRGSTTPPPPHPREVLRIEHLSLTVAISLHLEL